MKKSIIYKRWAAMSKNIAALCGILTFHERIFCVLSRFMSVFFLFLHVFLLFPQTLLLILRLPVSIRKEVFLCIQLDSIGIPVVIVAIRFQHACLYVIP